MNFKTNPLKRAIRQFGSLILCAVLIVSISSTAAYACTGVYVGQNVSDDGTVLIAKSNDYQDVWANYVTITERVENAPGRTMPVDNGATVFAALPDTTYRYTSTPWMDSTTAANGLEKDATVCANEYGVTMIMSITSFSNEAALNAERTDRIHGGGSGGLPERHGTGGCRGFGLPARHLRQQRGEHRHHCRSDGGLVCGNV